MTQRNRRLAGAARRLLGGGTDRLLLRLALRRNYSLVPRTYSSPIPDVDALPADIWDRRTSMRGIEFDTGTQLEWCERELRDHVRELQAPRAGEPGGGRFFFENEYYEHGDAELAYAVVRRFKPSRIIELGSGFSTLVLAQACVENEAEGHPCQLVANDPYQRGVVIPGVPGLTELKERPAQEIPFAEFEELGENDILFVDTTHVVKLGGDVNHVILEVLPALRPGVLVHFHDIWLPDQYHRALTEILLQHWTEQYLLQAFLIGNRGYEVLFATHAVAADHRERFEALVPGYTGATYPSSFWLRRVAVRYSTGER